MKKLWSLSSIAVFSSFLGISFLSLTPAEAAVINHSDVNGLRTFEEVETGLIWADLDNFFNQNTTNMKTTVEAAGFTFAEKSSVQNLLAGLPNYSPTEWNSYASIMGRAPSRDLIWGSYDDGDNDSNRVGYAYSGLSEISIYDGWVISDNIISIDSIPNNPDFLQYRDMNMFAYKTQTSSTAVPEPFTIVGTLVGGTAALRMRKKLKSVNKK